MINKVKCSLNSRQLTKNCIVLHHFKYSVFNGIITANYIVCFTLLSVYCLITNNKVYEYEQLTLFTHHHHIVRMTACCYVRRLHHAVCQSSFQPCALNRAVVNGRRGWNHTQPVEEIRIGKQILSFCFIEPVCASLGMQLQCIYACFPSHVIVPVLFQFHVLNNSLVWLHIQIVSLVVVSIPKFSL